MQANKIIDKALISAEELLTPDEKLQVATAWKNGISKNWAGVDIFLKHNLVECVNYRRILPPEAGFLKTRHMLCTRNFYLAKRLADLRGLKMKVKNPRGATWYKSRGLLLVWDVVLNDWRMADVSNAALWRILDFTPFVTEEQFRNIANMWTTTLKEMSNPTTSALRTYCNYFRQGV